MLSLLLPDVSSRDRLSSLSHVGHRRSFSRARRGRGETIDPVTRLPLGVDLESQRQRMAESLIEEGYTEDYIIDALEEIEPVIHPSLQPETPLQIEQRQAHWERLILEARDRALQRPPSAALS